MMPRGRIPPSFSTCLPIHNFWLYLQRLSEEVEKPSDRLEPGLRVGCGALAGFAVGFVGALGSGDYELFGALAIGLGIAVAFALAALRFGQRFLDKLVDQPFGSWAAGGKKSGRKSGST